MFIFFDVTKKPLFEWTNSICTSSDSETKDLIAQREADILSELLFYPRERERLFFLQSLRPKTVDAQPNVWYRPANWTFWSFQRASFCRKLSPRVRTKRVEIVQSICKRELPFDGS